MSYLNQSLRKTKADSYSVWKRLAMSVMFFSVCLMMSSVSLADDTQGKKGSTGIMAQNWEVTAQKKASKGNVPQSRQSEKDPTEQFYQGAVSTVIELPSMPAMGRGRLGLDPGQPPYPYPGDRTALGIVRCYSGDVNRAHFCGNVTKTLKDLSENFPGCDEQFKSLAELPSPERASIVVAVAMKLNKILELKTDPKAFKLEKKILVSDFKAEMLAKEIKKLKDPATKKEKIESLRKLLDGSFQLRQKRRQLEAAAITAELEKIVSFLKKRESHKEEIIQRRLDQLTDDKTLDW